MADLEPFWREAMDALSWQAAAVAALLACVMLLAMRRGRSALVTGLSRFAVVVVAIAATLAVFSLVADLQDDAERRALAGRANDIAARALLPGSPLGCLDGEAGETVENACEKALFARPETAATAIAYTEARLALLSDALKFDADPALIAGLRRSLELDRYGLAAQVLATRDGCTAERCAAFALIENADTLKANLKVRAYDTYVARYAPDWGKEPALADAPKANDKSAEKADKAEVAAQPGGAPTAPFNSRYDFPSSASIPPVSIMTSEPPRPPEGQAPPVAAEPGGAPRLPPKRPQTQGAGAR